MTKEESETVIGWCDAEGYLRPATQESRGEVTLTWYPSIGQPAFSTKNFQSARHWCQIMKIEHQAGELGYQTRGYTEKGKYD